ncbi:hypothetical protein PZ938_16440 [Luteipulveratus sp. YIM 133132]|uniref:hypothetical protein n=1 Tax=Luteipulveratus flavus TaxID=3031728 RepID=UPI0023B113FD|nr:hypothetical protein [Luteipulveratus sp. YIM 133132]MDE9367209.1 hypothetical protein [Luteipulveratus sp. YIM 133132]
MGGSGEASTQVTAGLGGFVVLFCLAVACYFLFRGMNKRLRGVRYREEQQALETERTAGEKEQGTDGGTPAGPASH